MQELERELLEMILVACERAPALAGLVDEDSPLIDPDGPLGLDSLDAVEIVALVQARFGVRIASKETSRDILRSLATLAAHIRLHRSPES